MLFGSEILLRLLRTMNWKIQNVRCDDFCFEKKAKCNGTVEKKVVRHASNGKNCKKIAKVYDYDGCAPIT